MMEVMMCFPIKMVFSSTCFWQNRTFRRVGFGLLCWSVAMPSAMAFCEEVKFFTEAAACHDTITDDALEFMRLRMRRAILQHINDSDRESKPSYASDDHFDSCNFDGGVALINDRYSKDKIGPLIEKIEKPLGVINAFSPELDESGNERTLVLFRAMYRWADILHAAQDFYAHSNWIEMGFTDPATQLFDARPIQWREYPDGWSVVRDDILTSQDDVRSGWKLADNSEPRIPRIVSPEGINHRVLISGSKFNPFQGCPSLSLFRPLGLGHGTLNKDNENRPGHREAAKMAIGQTEHEWCRMLHMTFDKGGSPAVAVPLILLVDPGDRPVRPPGTMRALAIPSHGGPLGPRDDGPVFDRPVHPHLEDNPDIPKPPKVVYTPHPKGSICEASAPGPVAVNVSVTEIQVRDAAQRDKKTGLNFVLGAFTQDLKFSSRSESVLIAVGDDGKVSENDLPRSIQFCMQKNDRLLVTLQGWQKKKGERFADLAEEDAVFWGVTQSVGKQGEDISPHLGQQLQASSDNPRFQELNVKFNVSHGTQRCDLPGQVIGR
jgi:hypothetical protein